MKEKYTIMAIYEPDFGCEGLPDGEILMDDVYLKDSSGNERVIQVSDDLLYELKLNEGDVLFLDENGTVSK